MSFAAYQATISGWTEKIEKQRLFARLWEKDASLWTNNKSAHDEIRQRLGWLALPQSMRSQVSEIKAYAKTLSQRFSTVVLLGMGGSSLAPELFARVFGRAEGFPELIVLDSTDPGRIADVETRLDLPKTHFIVSSKSGGTIELMSLYKYFYAKCLSASLPKESHFTVITDAGTPLDTLAAAEGFRVFHAPSDVGGRFSALTPFGLVPAAILGIDIAALLDSAAQMAEACSAKTAASKNAAAELGVGMAVLAEEGRDKLTILTSASLASFGDWAEQLVAESTGKEDVGVIPVVGEPVGKPGVYGQDRFFVAVLEAQDTSLDAALAALKKAGHPALEIRLADKRDLGGEFFRWEMATAVACSLLKVNAFDQPDVQAAKDRTKGLLKELAAGKELTPRESQNTLEPFWEDVEPDNYVAVLAFLPDRPYVAKQLGILRKEIRDKTRLAATVGIGPRYLHSTGQLHKGGLNKGAFILITGAHAEDLPVPGEKYTFAQLELAQAMGDFEALESKARWLVHVRLSGVGEAEVESACRSISGAIRGSAELKKETQKS